MNHAKKRNHPTLPYSIFMKKSVDKSVENPLNNFLKTRIYPHYKGYSIGLVDNPKVIKVVL